MARVNLEVQKETKEEWEKAAKNDPNAGGNLSGFVRSAVMAKINNNSESHGKEDIHKEITELKDMVADLTQSLQTTNARLSELETDIRSDPEIEKLANELFSRLPTEREFEEWHGGKGEKLKLDQQPEEKRTIVKAERGGELDAFTEILDCSPLEIQDAINYLMKSTPLIQEAEISGETRVYREK
ncbi:hypothetical protein [Natronosalvus rutilus]|uniref:Uncharacterized protein n=1 Tax=Natronosalvus rutilus TaxID=2953753 RepID=A0A9E7SWR5_9EURY|nr:hypothetical protein [Natronosalvus rutilus]UTF53413.1 hypothetical protein NGM29_16845 [Natronosalvus rutilus]